MKILLLGARGMLGSDLQDVFADWDLTALDQSDIDITDAAAVQERVAAVAPELIINAAAYTAVDDAEEHREAAFAVNAEGVRNVAMAAKEAGARLVHYSTDYVFAGTDEAGYAEDDAPGPAVNVYGESKLAGEQALAEVGPEYFLLRTAWLYGKHGKNFVETMLRLGTERDELRVIDDQHGSPTYTKDVAEATRDLVTGEYAPGVYHAVNSGSTTWYGFASKIFELAGLGVKVVPITSAEYPLPARRPQYSILQNTKGPELRTWEEALGDYLSSRNAT